MITLNIYKAQSTVKDDRIESITISLDEEIPNLSNLKDQEQCFEKEAETLCSYLIGTLPGGTLGRLTAKLMLHHASLFVVPNKG